MSTTTSPPAYSRTFYWFWFAGGTIISMMLNGLHARLTAPLAWEKYSPGLAVPSWFVIAAVGVALIPPVALAAATHALVKPDPNTSSGRGTGSRSTAWSIALAALTFSTVMVTDLTRTLLDVPLYLAVLIPLIVDVSIVGAVLRLEIRRHGHAAEAHVPESPLERPEQGEAPVVHPLGQSEEHPLGHEEVVQEAVVEQASVVQEPPLGQFVERPLGQSKPPREPRPPRTVEQTLVVSDPEWLAQRIADETAVTTPVDTIVTVLERAMEGMSQRRIAAAVEGVSPTTVGRILLAARELNTDHPRDLVAV